MYTFHNTINILYGSWASCRRSFRIFVLLNVKSIETKSELYESEIDLGSEMDLWLTIFFHITFPLFEGKRKKWKLYVGYGYGGFMKKQNCIGVVGCSFFLGGTVKFVNTKRSQINDITL